MHRALLLALLLTPAVAHGDTSVPAPKHAAKKRAKAPRKITPDDADRCWRDWQEEYQHGQGMPLPLWPDCPRKPERL